MRRCRFEQLQGQLGFAGTGCRLDTIDSGGGLDSRHPGGKAIGQLADCSLQLVTQHVHAWRDPKLVEQEPAQVGAIDFAVGGSQPLLHQRRHFLVVRRIDDSFARD